LCSEFAKIKCKRWGTLPYTFYNHVYFLSLQRNILPYTLDTCTHHILKISILLHVINYDSLITFCLKLSQRESHSSNKYHEGTLISFKMLLYMCVTLHYEFLTILLETSKCIYIEYVCMSLQTNTLFHFPASCKHVRPSLLFSSSLNLKFLLLLNSKVLMILQLFVLGFP